MVNQPFIPAKLPLEDLDWGRLIPFTSRASRALGRYDGTLSGMVNASVLLSPITGQEAVLSSRIEGTQASLSEVLQHEAGTEYSEEKRHDIKEILNYRRALLMGEEALSERRLTLQFIREMHAMLMTDVRGGDQTPGAFRTEQNWIGTPGTPMAKARYVPPSPPVMQDALENLENYMAAEERDPLVQLAIVHAQFEIIHPFNDGNGRMGRMLIPLLLFQKGVLTRPMFYLSEYFEETDQHYRDRLLAITEAGAWQEWIEYFLEAVHTQATRNVEKANQIHNLYDELKPRFAEVTHSQFAVAALDAFFKKPILNGGDFLRLSGIDTRTTASGLLRQLLDADLIRLLRPASGRRSAVYVMPSLINIAEGYEAF